MKVLSDMKKVRIKEKAGELSVIMRRGMRRC